MLPFHISLGRMREMPRGYQCKNCSVELNIKTLTIFTLCLKALKGRKKGRPLMAKWFLFMIILKLPLQSMIGNIRQFIAVFIAEYSIEIFKKR